MQNNTSLKIDVDDANKLLNSLLGKGYIQEPPHNEYIAWRVSNDLNTVIYYKSKSLVIQGHGDINEIVNLIPSDTKDNNDSFLPHIGSDEVGKGDYFGPLVVCSAFVDDNCLNVIRKLGIADSKTLTDTKMLDIYEKIKDKVEFEVAVEVPEIYNERLKDFKNVSYYLATLHREVAVKLKMKLENKGIKVNAITIDQFSLNKSRLENEFKNMGFKLSQFHKGESDIAVALASVIARAVFLLEFKKMSEKYSFDFPKGATTVIDAAKLFVKKYPVEELRNVAKISFKTTSQVISFS